MSIPLFVSESSKPETTTQPLSVGSPIFERMDQIDFTGPFEVLSRMPDTTVRIIAKEPAPIRDVQGLRLTPDARIAEAGIFDVLPPFVRVIISCAVQCRRPGCICNLARFRQSEQKLAHSVFDTQFTNGREQTPSS